MIEIDTTLLSVLFAFFGAFYSLLLIVVLRARRRRKVPEGVSTRSRFSIMVPARNEESVLARTLEGILAVDYPAARIEILVIDDGSADRTAEIAAGFATRHPERVSVIHVPEGKSGRGKSEALNLGFRHLLRTSRFNGFRDWVIGVFDADGVPDADLLQKAAAQFENPKVGAVQASVRIANRHTSRLARMQDLEFSAFSRVTQMVRGELLDSASLGGNGQFVRARALYEAAISCKPHRFWRPGALTEDLELSARLVLRSWRIKHLATSYVHQEGVETLTDLFRQRTRWAWGSLQVFVEYILKLRFLRARNVPFKKRLDLAMSLSLFLMSPLVMVVWLLTFLDLIHVIEAVNHLPFLATLAISFGFFPIVTWGMWDQKEYRKPRLVLDLILFTVYTYHWLPCLYVAALRVIGGDDPKWFKTRRIAEAAARTSTGRRIVERVSSWATAPRVASLAAFVLLAFVAGYLRWIRGALLDPFEDPYQHWWIAGYTVETGRYYDSFSAMTHGNWLPLYDFGIAGMFPVAGLHNMAALKFVSLLFSIGTMALVWLVARSRGRGAAWAAAAFFAFTPSAILAGTMALPEAPTGFALLAVYYLLFHSLLPVRWRHPLAAVAMVAAVALRYEAWFFLALLLAYFLARRNPRMSRGDLLLVATPALLFMGTWLLFTSQWGFLPNTIIAQTSVDPGYKAAIGSQEPFGAALAD
ncbi:MAG TPA: glycosyltransferase family 2 protein, partial [Thermoplasmata archaeon]|nr:glycosyltransferase family 2 protein [Thermoplasmata archaeon]